MPFYSPNGGEITSPGHRPGKTNALSPGAGRQLLIAEIGMRRCPSCQGGVPRLRGEVVVFCNTTPFPTYVGTNPSLKSQKEGKVHGRV